MKSGAAHVNLLLEVLDGVELLAASGDTGRRGRGRQADRGMDGVEWVRGVIA